jgi:plasmid stabilization system protein ParE
LKTRWKPAASADFRRIFAQTASRANLLAVLHWDCIRY